MIFKTYNTLQSIQTIILNSFVACLPVFLLQHVLVSSEIKTSAPPHVRYPFGQIPYDVIMIFLYLAGKTKFHLCHLN